MVDENTKQVADQLEKAGVILGLKSDTREQLQAALAAYINQLITTDFSPFINVLYRLDISEDKLKQLLSNTADAPAGDLVAGMIIERQLQKIAARKRFMFYTGNIPDDEKW